MVGQEIYTVGYGGNIRESEREVRNAGTETGYAQVGAEPCSVDNLGTIFAGGSGDR